MFMQRKARQLMWGPVDGFEAGLGAAGSHHSRRREFCCLEPGAGGGRGGVASHFSVLRRVSEIFWRVGMDGGTSVRVLT